MATDFVRLFDLARYRELLASGPLGPEREPMIYEQCFASEFLYIDYWGCYLEAFSGADSEGSLNSQDLLPETKGTGFLLLLPEHVDRMIASLEEHWADRQIMTEESMDKLRAWRDRCARERSFHVAYVFDC